MSFQLVRAVVAIENTDELHLGRLLLLMLAADQRSSSSNSATVEGITKLAKLDFLLRYPNCLERALKSNSTKVPFIEIPVFERTNIESKMIRFKYGPWDKRYRRWIGILSSKGLVDVHLKGRTVHIRLTDKGRKVAQQFADEPAYKELNERSKQVIKSFGSMSSTKIKDFIYKVFPELLTMKWGEEIVI